MIQILAGSEIYPTAVWALATKTTNWRIAKSSRDWEDISIYLMAASLECHANHRDDYYLLINIANQHALDADIHTTTTKFGSLECLADKFGSLECLADIACKIDEYKEALDSHPRQQLANMAHDLHELVAREADERAGEIYAEDGAP